MPAHNAWTREHIDMVFPAHLVKHLPHEWRTCNGQQDSVFSFASLAATSATMMWNVNVQQCWSDR